MLDCARHLCCGQRGGARRPPPQPRQLPKSLSAIGLVACLPLAPAPTRRRATAVGAEGALTKLELVAAQNRCEAQPRAPEAHHNVDRSRSPASGCGRWHNQRNPPPRKCRRSGLRHRQRGRWNRYSLIAHRPAWTRGKNGRRGGDTCDSRQCGQWSSRRRGKTHRCGGRRGRFYIPAHPVVDEDSHTKTDTDHCWHRQARLITAHM